MRGVDKRTGTVLESFVSAKDDMQNEGVLCDGGGVPIRMGEEEGSGAGVGVVLVSLLLMWRVVEGLGEEVGDGELEEGQAKAKSCA